MIKIIFIFLLIALPVFAQDGLREDISVPTESATRAVSPAGSVTPRPTIAATSAPALATSEPTSKESAPSSNSDVLGIAVFAAAVLALGGYGAYKLKTKKSEKNDGQRCFNLKRMMEDKLKELTDLRGQAEGKIKENAREKVRESLKGTSTGEALAKIERVEKEYARIKKLYEKCIIEFSQKKKKTILVDVVYTFVDTRGNIFKEMRELLEKYPNRKILLTGADDRQFKEWGLDKMPYEIWTLKHNPEKTDPEYYKKMLTHFELIANDVIYFEHSPEAVASAKSIGIKTYYYDSKKKDLTALKNFLDENL